jgi:uncharacterized protein (UPF0262 family)
MTDYLSHIDIDDTGLAPPTPEIAQERKVAIFDLLEANSFSVPARNGQEAPVGPYKLKLATQEGRLVFDISTEADEKVSEIQLSLSPFRQVIKDYFQICEAYFDAVKRLPPGQIEAIDMGRRGIHDEGARLIEERLNGKLVVDSQTSRRLFTLICVLHFKG